MQHCPAKPHSTGCSSSAVYTTGSGLYNTAHCKTNPELSLCLGLVLSFFCGTGCCCHGEELGSSGTFHFALDRSSAPLSVTFLIELCFSHLAALAWVKCVLVSASFTAETPISVPHFSFSCSAICCLRDLEPQLSSVCAKIFVIAARCLHYRTCHKTR